MIMVMHLHFCSQGIAKKAKNILNSFKKDVSYSQSVLKKGQFATSFIDNVEYQHLEAT